MCALTAEVRPFREQSIATSAEKRYRDIFSFSMNLFSERSGQVVPFRGLKDLFAFSALGLVTSPAWRSTETPGQDSGEKGTSFFQK